MARRDVTQKYAADCCNTCPMCGAVLTGKQKTCSVKCRVALHRRLAVQGITDGSGALVSVGVRVFAKNIGRAQLAARQELRREHKQRRAELKQEYKAKSAAMRNELPASDDEVAAGFHQRMLEQSEAGTLGIAIAKHDSILESIHPRSSQLKTEQGKENNNE